MLATQQPASLARHEHHAPRRQRNRPRPLSSTSGDRWRIQGRSRANATRYEAECFRGMARAPRTTWVALGPLGLRHVQLFVCRRRRLDGRQLLETIYVRPGGRFFDYAEFLVERGCVDGGSDRDDTLVEGVALSGESLGKYLCWRSQDVGRCGNLVRRKAIVVLHVLRVDRDHVYGAHRGAGLDMDSPFVGFWFGDDMTRSRRSAYQRRGVRAGGTEISRTAPFARSMSTTVGPRSHSQVVALAKQVNPCRQKPPSW